MSDKFGKLEITQLTIVILGKNHNPSLLNPDFLKFNKIVNEDWKVGFPVFTTEKISQVVYKNRVSISVHPNQLLFAQPIEGKYSQDLILLPEIIIRYLEVLPHVNYYGMGINPKGHVLFESEEELENYMPNFLFRPGDWKKFLDKQPSLSATLTYPFEDHSISISIDPVSIIEENQESTKKQGILFEGNIHRDFSQNESLEKRLEKIKYSLSHWHQDIDNYISLVNGCLLNQG